MADPLRKFDDAEAVVAFPEQLLPGSFVKLDQHPSDLPAFELIRCQGRRCWVRQQAWGQFVQWEVEHERLRAA